MQNEVSEQAPQVSQPASTDPSFGDILSEFEHSHRRSSRKEGEGREGTVVAISAESVFIDIGFKTEGVIPRSEFVDSSGNLEIEKGQKVVVSIQGRDSEGYYQLSKLRVERPKDWSSLERAFDQKLNIAGVVSEVVKGGLSVDVGVRAFMPASRSGAKDAAEMEKLIGQEIQCRIIKLDVADEDVVVDRRVVLEEESAAARDQHFATFQEGMVLRGTVRSLMEYGAFVDLGGVDGLLHVADISWGRINKPSDVLNIGDSVEVKILKVEREKRRISLGLKQLIPDPWSMAEEKYKPGDRIRGTVSRLAEFGAFVELEPGLDGLIHLSELSWSRKIRKPGDVLKEGEAVEAVVLGVQPGERRIALGLKQALGDPWEEAEKKYPIGGTVEGLVTNLAKFGAFVELGEGIEGMIHIGDMSAEKRIEHPQEVLKPGQAVRAAILEVDKEKRRIRLGLKQLQPTSLDEYIAEHKVGDVVTGRVTEVLKSEVRVELGEGIRGVCAIGKAQESVAVAAAAEDKPDLSRLTSMLSAKWKQGKVIGAAVKQEPLRAGQIRSFRISNLDAKQKQINLELAG